MRYLPFPEHVLEVFILASRTAQVEGYNWYTDAHNFARSLDSNVETAAGVIAAMSPLNGWKNNKRVASLLYSGERNLGLSRNEAKAIRILSGEHPLDVLGGDKVRAFYSTILDPYNPHSVPVIDRHAHDIAIGSRVSNNHPSRNLDVKGRYESFARVYSECAESLSIGAPQLQAITWLAWRERFGVNWY